MVEAIHEGSVRGLNEDPYKTGVSKPSKYYLAKAVVLSYWLDEEGRPTQPIAPYMEGRHLDLLGESYENLIWKYKVPEAEIDAQRRYFQREQAAKEAA